ncbi:MAG TPA: nitroreductase family deazaflavin-dependent oxidoreductase [Jatrophihabitans sp.]|jgi:deazaflavin-dependent oxidoreductase (nitroreductase family)|nr:nitroreductase family deazaflavin-dependent oxidoreductase [Jatrophihabitans sp.]
MTKVKPKPKGLDRPSTTRAIKLMSRVNTRVYRITGGRLGRKWRIGAGFRKPVPICLLTTTGRKTGEPRTVPLCYLSDGDRIVFAASQGGLPANPQWYYNVKANPGVEIEIGRRRLRCTARVATADERAALWPRLVAMYADYASYQSWTEREIPVVICEPIG